MFMAIAVFGY